MHTRCVHGQALSRQNQFLLFSWSFEGLLELVYAISESYFDRKTLLNFEAIIVLISTINIVIFMLLMFKLQAVLIYMDDENLTERQINNKLKRLNW